MTHEPECLNVAGDCCPDVGALSVTGECGCQCTCAELKAAYQRGYTAHARYRDHGETPPTWVQHGSGENP